MAAGVEGAIAPRAREIRRAPSRSTGKYRRLSSSIDTRAACPETFNAASTWLLWLKSGAATVRIPISDS
jgi:hypothetical protein